MKDEHRAQLIEEFGEEHAEHTEWWGEEMEYCREKLAPLLGHVRADEAMQLAQHGTSVDSDGVHKVRLSFEVEGEPWEWEDS